MGSSSLISLPHGARLPDFDHLAWLRRDGLDQVQAKSILDLGCGSGALCQHFVEQGASHVVGVDILPPTRPAEGWRYLNVDLNGSSWPHSLATAQGGFDLVLAFDIIEHLRSPVDFLASVRQILNTGGSLVLTTPNTNSWERWLRRERWSGATDPQHLLLFNLYSLRFLLERSGYKIKRLAAPVRSLKGLSGLMPQVGAQILCVASR